MDAIRARIARPPVAEWRLVDVVEEDDIDMSDMPEISAVHYGMSPSETLEGDCFKAAVKKDDDDDDATLVLNE